MRWPGGKAQKAKHLASALSTRMPNHRKYVEPFAGSAAVFLAMPPARQSVLGDKDAGLIRFHDKARKGAMRRVKPWRSSRSSWKAACKNRNKSARALFVCQQDSFSGNGKDYDTSAEGRMRATRKLSRAKLRRIERRLRQARLAIAEWDATMRKHDGVGTLHFLDPPWESTYSRFYEDDEYDVTPANVARVSRGMRGGVAIVYGNTPGVRKAFCKRGSGFKCYNYTARGLKGSGRTPRTSKRGQLFIWKAPRKTKRNSR